jgi:hypothetical protein
MIAYLSNTHKIFVANHESRTAKFDNVMTLHGAISTYEVSTLGVTWDDFDKKIFYDVDHEFMRDVQLKEDESWEDSFHNNVDVLALIKMSNEEINQAISSAKSAGCDIIFNVKRATIETVGVEHETAAGKDGDLEEIQTVEKSDSLIYLVQFYHIESKKSFFKFSPIIRNPFGKEESDKIHNDINFHLETTVLRPFVQACWAQLYENILKPLYKILV